MNWYDARREYVTASDLYVLFDDVEPGFKTRWELWHEKRGTIERIPETEAMRMGTLLEPVVLQLAAEKLGAEVVPWGESPRVVTASDVGWLDCIKDNKPVRLLTDRAIASTPDGVVDGNVPVECKTTSAWDGEVKLSWALQVNAQMHHLGADHGYVAVLVAGRTFELCRLEYDAELYAVCQTRAAAFMADVRNGIEPKVDWQSVGGAVERVYPKDDGGEVERPDLEALVGLVHEAKQRVKEAKERADALEAHLRYEVGTSATVRAAGWKVVCKSSDGSPGKVITADMVGTIIGARAGFRALRVYPPKDKKA